MQRISLDQKNRPTTDLPLASIPGQLPTPKATKHHPFKSGGSASLLFVGTATTILEWAGVRLMTDPNFLPRGDHVHLAPGVSSERLTDPALQLHELPRVDLILLSHYHEDHFDKRVEALLRRDIPIITTPQAKKRLISGEEPFTSVYAIDPFEEIEINIQGTEGSEQPRLRVTGMPGKHVPPHRVIERLNTITNAIPPTNGWMLELGQCTNMDFACGYRIYITGDTLMADELREIPKRYAGRKIDMMLVHLGGTTIPSPLVGRLMEPLTLMPTMDAEEGLQLIQLIQPDVTIPIHYDDYDVFASPLEDFRRIVEAAGFSGQVVILDRGEQYKFF